MVLDELLLDDSDLLDEELEDRESKAVLDVELDDSLLDELDDSDLDELEDIET